MGCQGSLLLPGEPLLQPHLHASQLCPPDHGASLWLRDLPGPTSWYNLPWSPEPAHHPVPTVCSAPADTPVPPGCTAGAPRRVGAPGSCQVTSPPATGPSRTQPAGGAGVASCCPTQSLQPGACQGAHATPCHLQALSAETPVDANRGCPMLWEPELCPRGLPTLPVSQSFGQAWGIFLCPFALSWPKWAGGLVAGALCGLEGWAGHPLPPR